MFTGFSRKKNEIFQDDVHLSSDLTKSQRECYNTVNAQRKERLNDGEKDLIIKFIDGYPTIVKKRSVNGNKNNNESNAKN